jgi:flavin-dependent dehydrogenase
VKALKDGAERAQARVRPRCAVRGLQWGPAQVTLATDAGPVQASLVVAADGLASPLRRAAGLEAPARGPLRFGLRRHYRGEGDGTFVEIHFGPGVEAYLTPTGKGRLGVALLFERTFGPTTFDSLLARLPGLAARLARATPDSEVRGAGPLRRRVLGRVRDRLALLGDAAGYVDAITGEGLSLGLLAAEALGGGLPAVLEAGATRRALQPYARWAAGAYRRYAWTAGTLLAMARRPGLRRGALSLLGRAPWLFERILRAVAQEARGSPEQGWTGLPRSRRGNLNDVECENSVS